jgi:hypothetical protein
VSILVVAPIEQGFDNQHVREVEANVTEEGEDWRPVQVRHRDLGLTWTVRQVLASWRHPGHPQKTYGRPVVSRRHRLRVYGPLPGRPHQFGEFVMIATEYGHRPRWWIRPEADGQSRR